MGIEEDIVCCRKCKFYAEPVSECRRHAPKPEVEVVEANSDNSALKEESTVWPFVPGYEWCGEWQEYVDCEE